MLRLERPSPRPLSRTVPRHTLFSEQHCGSGLKASGYSTGQPLVRDSLPIREYYICFIGLRSVDCLGLLGFTELESGPATVLVKGSSRWATGLVRGCAV